MEEVLMMEISHCPSLKQKIIVLSFVQIHHLLMETYHQAKEELIFGYFKPTPWEIYYGKKLMVEVKMKMVTPYWKQNMEILS